MTDTLVKIQFVSADGLEATHYTSRNILMPDYYRLLVQRPSATILGWESADSVNPKRHYRHFRTNEDGSLVYYEVLEK